MEKKFGPEMVGENIFTPKSRVPFYYDMLRLCYVIISQKLEKEESKDGRNQTIYVLLVIFFNTNFAAKRVA